MNIQKISNKASVFLNHKHFHPGNSKNREKLWLAEEKLKEEERRQEELLRKRKKEWEIEELRRDLRQSQKRTSSSADTDTRAGNSNEEPNKLFRKVFSENSRNPNFQVRSELYEEDYHIGNHSAIWGSFYNVESKRWGFRCCRSTEFNSICSRSGKKFNKSRLRSGNHPIDTLFGSEHQLSPPKSLEELDAEESISTRENDLGHSSCDKALQSYTGKPFTKQSKGVSELVNLLSRPQTESEA